MTDIASMEALLARAEQASGPDRQIDRLISCLPGGPNYCREHDGLVSYFRHADRDGRGRSAAFATGLKGDRFDGFNEHAWPYYTASIDAIAALTEREFPNAMFRVVSDPDSGGVVAELVFAQPPFDHFKAHGNTEALARTAVFLRACIAMERKE